MPQHVQAMSEPVRTRLVGAVAICCARPTLRRIVRIALVVGFVLTAMNEGDTLLRGTVTSATVIKIAFDFVVLFVVSNLGVLAGTGRA